LVGGKNSEEILNLLHCFSTDQSKATIFFTVFPPTNQKPSRAMA
jgi:hypothetical protein